MGIGQFSEAALREWLPFAIFHATEKSQKVAAAASGPISA